MILDLTKSKLFKVNPDLRFSREYQVPVGTWNEAWRRYKFLDYTKADVKDYIFIKYVRNLNTTTIDRWIVRSEIYTIVNPLMKKGVTHVNSNIFGKYEEDVMNELLKRIQSGASKTSRTII